jgi:hypothetical protein
VGDENDAARSPTLLVPLRNLLEQAAASAHIKHLSGEVQVSGELLQPEVLDKVVAQLSPAVLAFLAFHPGVDTPIADYVKAGSLSSDSGRKVFVLFTTDTHVFSPKFSNDAGIFSGDVIPGIHIDAGIHPAYEMIRMLFEPDPPPTLPGIALFKDFGDPEVVYVELTELTSSLEVAQRLREVFALATEAGSQASDRKFADVVSAKLQKQRIPYRRTGRRSVREWFIRGYQFLWDNRSDIVAAATPFV